MKIPEPDLFKRYNFQAVVIRLDFKGAAILMLISFA
jgi:hypothetical protein